MSQDNICVSAFGFKDVVCINGKTYTVPENIPSVIIEDPEHKFNMYSHDAIFERTGMGLNQLDDHKVRIPVCVLWQQIKQFESSEQYDAAKRLSKYILSLIIYAYSELDMTSEDNEPINKAYLRSNAQITLCIPDFFDEAEQQCLLDAFDGFNFRLLWRSIASIIGSFREENPHLDRSNHDTQITVFYLGPDSFDVTSYDYQIEEDGYITPIRRTPVYSNCSLEISYPTIAISNAAQVLNRWLDPKSNFSQDLRASILSQMFFNSPFIWLEHPDDDLNASEALCINTNTGNHWLVFNSKNISLQDFITNKAQLNVAESFLKDYNIIGDSYYSKFSINDSFKSILNHQLCDLLIKQPKKRDYIIFTGPFAFNILTKEVFEIIPPNTRSCTNMATGGYIFNDRMNQDLPTYLDSMRKLSMISRNEFNEYIEKVLIRAATVRPGVTFRSDPIRQKITSGAKGIELYISSNEKFNNDTINQATSVSFVDQNIDVYTATLPFKSGAQVDTEETVSVTVEQKVLSGYVKMLIKPEGDSKVLPKFGLTAAFDPNTKKLFEGLLQSLQTGYPNLVKPTLYYGTELKYQLGRTNLVFSSTNKTSEVLYYNNVFAHNYLKPQIFNIINRQLSDIQHLLNQPQTTYSITNVLKKVGANSFLMLTSPELISNNQYMTMVSYFETAIHTLFKDPNRSNELVKALRLYGRMIPDTPLYCKKCSTFYGILAYHLVNYAVLYDIRVFIENHPQSFNASGDDFAMSYELSNVLLEGCKNILLNKIINNGEVFDPSYVLYSESIKGSLNLSRCLAGMMYALLWRKRDRYFLNTAKSISQYVNLLSYIKDRIIELGRQADRSYISNKAFEERLKAFVSNTPVTINGVIEYLQNKGTNTNIMANIDDVNQE